MISRISCQIDIIWSQKWKALWNSNIKNITIYLPANLSYKQYKDHAQWWTISHLNFSKMFGRHIYMNSWNYLLANNGFWNVHNFMEFQQLLKMKRSEALMTKFTHLFESMVSASFFFIFNIWLIVQNTHGKIQYTHWKN